MRFQVGELHFKSHRTGNIVGVHSRNEFPAGNINQSVEGWRQPLVGLSEQMYPSIPFGKAFEMFAVLSVEPSSAMRNSNSE